VISGEMRAGAGGVAQRSSLTITLDVDARKQDASGQGCAAAAARVERRRDDGLLHCLLNAMAARNDSAFGRLRAVVTRLDALSHCLFWADAAAPRKCVLIELPRVGLSFTRHIDANLGVPVSVRATPITCN
jgi:hypothetical protein